MGKIWGLWLILLFGCGAPVAKLSEEWSPSNDPKLFGAHVLDLETVQDPKSLGGTLAQRPWSDTYWPLKAKGLADRWLGDSLPPAGFTEQKAAALTAISKGVEATFELSPAEKYDLVNSNDQFSMTKEAWDTFKQYENYEGPWGWMGHCHGWAAAAYLEEAPKHGVIAEGPKGEVLFTEGDIRGLITKAYAHNSMDRRTLFMGERCNAKSLKVDELGRVVDGVLHLESGEDQVIYMTRNDWSQRGLIFYTDEWGQGEVKVLQRVRAVYEPQGAFSVRMYDSMEAFRAGDSTYGKFTYLKSCRDLNAASFHLALIEYLSDRSSNKRGFVLEVSKGYEVWNQPAYGFISEIQVEPFEAESDPLGKYRAPGTTQIVQISTLLQYGIENGPYLHFEEKDELLRSMDLSYTLEINEEGQVIGGEWGEFSNSIDFVWAPQGKLRNSQLVDYDLVKKIHSCSLNDSDVVEREIAGNKLLVRACRL
jgi:hypothetical protein